MSFESIDNKGERSWEAASSKMNVHSAVNGKKEKQKLQVLLELLQKSPRGAYSLEERFNLYVFDPITYSAYPKKLSATNLKTLETYVLFDNVLNQAFLTLGPLSETGMRALQEHIQGQYDIPIEWIPVSESDWQELHAQLAQHIQALSSQREKDEKNRRALAQREIVNDDQAQEDDSSVKPDTDKKGSNVKRKEKHQVTFEDLINFFDAITLKLAQLDEKYEQMLDEESQANTDQKREIIKSKEKLKEEIKFEVNQQRILIEEIKKSNPM